VLRLARRLLKRGIRSSLLALIHLATLTSPVRYLLDQWLDAILCHSRKVAHEGVDLTFVVPTSFSLARATSFSSKEPETLAWIDGMKPGAVVWDIGANVGLYSCYAAKKHKCRVYAFEPSVFNLELLARNIFVNDLTDLVTIVPIPLSDQLAVNALNMSMTEWGGAMSTFGETYTHDGTPLKKVFEFRTVGCSMDHANIHLGITTPIYIKMDVDGIEHIILRGGPRVLSQVDSVLIEVNEAFPQQAQDSSRYLMEAGLELQAKSHSEMFAGTTVFNQIWCRKRIG